MSAINELSSLRQRRPKSASERRQRRKEEGRDNKAGYLFLLPWLIGLLAVTLGPMAASLYLAFTDYSLLKAPQWTGLDNIERMIHDERLHTSLVNTFVFVFVSVPLQLMLALLIAMALNKGLRGLALYRSVFYLPSLLGGSVAIAVLWRQMFGSEGLFNQVLGAFGIDSSIGWISDPTFALSSIILLNVWTFGAPMLIFLAGLRQIPEMYYEAAKVDGATRWVVFSRITLPMLSPIIFFNLVLQIIGSFQAFTQAFVVSGGSGGPSDSTLFFTLYLYQRGFGQFEMGYASAMAWLLLIIVAAFTAINFLLSKFWVFYDD
ncbi:carbohydrate ABC transporter permease [Streptomyces solaniscabiei]|uniref:carbohydrate ABC transporter permease n=1 Tax=Streptomyces solaniscabiei TaxID=2683255 RepID=UPI001CE2C3C7|nr:sugar ABC transporter permease [Streptomyces solaniscabiei]